ncbi:MAG: PIN domain-containing protein [Acidimicrobiales bacterium]
MTFLVLDAGGLTRLAERNQDALAMIGAFRRERLWPPVVPSIVLVESLSGRQRTDANVNRFLKAVDIREAVSVQVARRAAELRSRSRRGSAVDALVVAVAEPGGAVLTGDLDDLRALASHARDVTILRG